MQLVVENNLIKLHLGIRNKEKTLSEPKKLSINRTHKFSFVKAFALHNERKPLDDVQHSRNVV